MIIRHILLHVNLIRKREYISLNKNVGNIFILYIMVFNQKKKKKKCHPGDLYVNGTSYIIQFISIFRTASLKQSTEFEISSDQKRL